MRIAWFSPLPCRENADLISRYCTETLLPLLSERFEIELFHDGFESYKDYPTFHFLKAFQRHEERPFDLFFYQLEDDRRLYFSRIHLGLVPGVVWFHDFVLSDYGPEPILNSSWTETVRIFNGEKESWPDRKRKFKPQGPLAFREAGLAAIPLFSNQHAHQEYRRNVVEKIKIDSLAAPSCYLPYPLEIPVLEEHRRQESTFTIGFAGKPGVEGRVYKLLEALQRLPQFSLVWLIGRGERPAAEAVLKDYRCSRVEIVEGRSPERWAELLPRLDAAVHTWFSVYRQPGVYLAQSLLAGLPSIVTHFASGELLPENVVFKVEAGDTEAQQIQQALGAIKDQLPRRVRIASDYAHELYDRRAVASELCEFLISSRPYLDRVKRNWEKVRAQARSSLIAEARQISLSPGGHSLTGDLFNNHDIWNRIYAPAYEEFGW